MKAPNINVLRNYCHNLNIAAKNLLAKRGIPSKINGENVELQDDHVLFASELTNVVSEGFNGDKEHTWNTREALFVIVVQTDMKKDKDYRNTEIGTKHNLWVSTIDDIFDNAKSKRLLWSDSENGDLKYYLITKITPLDAPHDTNAQVGLEITFMRYLVQFSIAPSAYPDA